MEDLYFLSNLFSIFCSNFLVQNNVTELIPLDPVVNKTGNTWHVFLQGEFQDMLYGYKFDGKFSPEEGHYFDYSRVVLDPYAKVVFCLQFLKYIYLRIYFHSL